MANKTKLKETGKEKPSNVLAAFKEAANALLDSIELGLFKEVRATPESNYSDVKEMKTSFEFAGNLLFNRFKNGESSVALVETVANDGSNIVYIRIEDLYDNRGLFLDKNDAKRLLLKNKIEQLKEDEEQLTLKKELKAKEIKKLEKEIKKLESEVNKLG